MADDKLEQRARLPERPPKERIDEILRDRDWNVQHFHMRYFARRDYLQLCAEVDHLRAELASLRTPQAEVGR